MSKNRGEVFEEGRPVFYAIFYNSFRKAALDLGYALALHGSMQSDMDLIAVAWTEEAAPVIDLVNAISDCLGKTIWKDFHLKQSMTKPHGRITYTLSLFSDWHIDLSIIPPNKSVT